MEGLAGVIVVCAMFGVPGIYFFGKTDIGKAIVERLRGDGGQDSALLAELDEVRTRLAEVEERLDFAERAMIGGGDARSSAGVQEKRSAREAPV